MNPRDLNYKFLLLPLLGCLFASPAFAESCENAGDSYKGQLAIYQDKRDQAANDDDKKLAVNMIESIVRQQGDAIRACQDKERSARESEKKDQDKKDKIAKEKAECDSKSAATSGVFKWDGKNCVNKAEAKSLPDNDDCSAASIYSGELKGQNCKKAMNTVKDVKARNSALTDATTAATTAYSGLQASGATGAQDDAQTRQANIMKTLAMSKFATGALNLAGAMQLKSAATGAEQASSTITSAQKNIQAACANASDDQVCFYQNAAKNGISPDQQSYASFERMKRGATQSQEQADAANALAKTSMLTGAADMLVGLQAMKAAQMARNNAQQMAPPPLFIPPAPPPAVRFGDGGGGTGAPTLETQAAPPPIDYGNPSAGGDTFGGVNHGPVNGSLVGHMGVPTMTKAAASGVSGGAAAGGIAGGTLKSGGGGGKASTARRGGTAVGEYNLAGGGPKPGASADKGDGSNPMADMLAKLFPQDQAGKTIVDARQIASNGQFANNEPGEQSDTVTASDLSIFEQISSKYRQLNGSGRF